MSGHDPSSDVAATAHVRCRSAVPGRAGTIIIAAALLVAVLAVFAPVRNFDFVNFDDDDYVTANPFVRNGLNAESVRWAFTTFHAGHWHPLTWLSLALDCQVFGLRPGPLHVVNVAFHAVNVLLLFVWLVLATGRRWRSLVVAALFGFHPLRVESVAWVTERKDVLSGLFFLLSLWAYLFYARSAHRSAAARWYVALLACMLLGLFAKPILVVLPLVLLLVDVWPLGRLRAGARPAAAMRSPAFLLAEKGPLTALALAALAVTSAAQRSAGAMMSDTQVPVADRVANALWSYLRYLGKTLWPIDLAVFYPLEPVAVWRAVVAAAFLLLVTGLAYRLRIRRPYATVGWLWFVGVLLPVIGLVQFGGQALADRFTYLPHIGLFLAVVWGVGDLCRDRAALRLPLAFATGLLLVALVAFTSQQLEHWRDSASLFAHALEVTEGNYMAHNNLGVALEGLGRVDEAAQHYAAAVRFNPTWPEALNNLGNAFALRGNYSPAREHYERALRIRPGFAAAENNLATTFARQGDFDRAIEHYERAVVLDPRNVDARYALADSLQRRGRLRRAAQEYAAVLRIRPAWGPAHARLGGVLAELGDRGAAIEHYEDALRVMPGESSVQRALAALRN